MACLRPTVRLSATCGVWRTLSTSERYRALNAISIGCPSTVASISPTLSPDSALVAAVRREGSFPGLRVLDLDGFDIADVGDEPGFGSVGEIGVGEEDDWCHVLECDFTGLVSRPETVGGRLGSGVGIVKRTDLFDPSTQIWRRVADTLKFREYHAVTLLLPDGVPVISIRWPTMLLSSVFFPTSSTLFAELPDDCSP